MSVTTNALATLSDADLAKKIELIEEEITCNEDELQFFRNEIEKLYAEKDRRRKNS